MAADTVGEEHASSKTWPTLRGWDPVGVQTTAGFKIPLGSDLGLL